MKKTLLIGLSIIMIALAGCKKDQNTWGMLKETSVTVMVGETVQLTFTNDGNKYPQWASTDEFIATVNESGLVTGAHVGKCVVSVNGLECTVNVTDKYATVMYEPWQEWTASATTDNQYVQDIIDYESSVRGQVIPEYTYDSVYEFVIVPDTSYVDPDSTMVITDDTIYSTEPKYLPVSIKFDYTGAGVADRYVDVVTYNLEIVEVTTGKFGVKLTDCSMLENSKHTADVDPFLKNRYAKSEDGTYYYYTIKGKKLCKIYTTTESGQSKVSYIADK